MPIDVMTSGSAMHVFHAWHAASMRWSQVSKTRFDSQLARMSCQMF
jgi:hypothetical protein